MPENVYVRIDKFHAHLDVCEQCRNHCFDLCAEGAKLLKYAATGEGELPGGHLGNGGNDGSQNRRTRR